MADNTVVTAGQGQVQVYFSTNSSDIELPEEKRQLRVPTGIENLSMSLTIY
jgi:ribosome biogenesis protein YTM1